ncbi:MAG: hypothetical protein AAB737_00205 [Patescibacteria group bacterium]
MTLIQKFLMVLAAMFVLGVAAPASAKTLTEIDSCKDAALAAAPFTGLVAKREFQAKHLDSTDTVLIDGEQVSATRPIWNLCEGPSLTEQLAAANTANTSLRGEVARLTVLAYKYTTTRDPVTDFVTSGTTYKDAASANEKKLAHTEAALKEAQFWGKWMLGGIAVLMLCLLYLLNQRRVHRAWFGYIWPAILWLAGGIVVSILWFIAGLSWLWEHSFDWKPAKKTRAPVDFTPDEPNTLGNVNPRGGTRSSN